MTWRFGLNRESGRGGAIQNPLTLNRKIILGRGIPFDVGQYRSEQSSAGQLEEFVTEIG